MSMTYTMHEVPAVTLKLDASQEPQFKLLRFDMTTSTLDEVVAALKYNGGVIVKNFLTPEQVAETKEIVTPILKKIGYKKASDPTKRVARLPTITPKLVETILTHETYLGVTDAILSIHHRSWLGQKLFETVETPITMASTMFAVGPGAKEQDLHRDDSIYFNKHLAIKPEEYEVGRDMSISFFIAGVDVTAANGATRFIPGSHLERYDDQPDPSRAVSAEMNAGDCFFMLSSCYHGAGENSTKDQERLVYSLFAMQPHLRQEENLYLATSLDVVKQYPLAVQKRLGYDVAVPNLGWVDHASPLETILGHAGADKRDIPGYNPPVTVTTDA